MSALPALIRTYSARANVPFQANASALNLAQSAIWSLKEHMKNTLTGGTVAGTRHANSVWTVMGSSNSTVAAMDAVDRWTTFANLVWAANGSAHSWIVLRNTTLGYEICLDCNPATSTSMGIAVAEIATPFTGGTTLTRPTATNEFMFGTTGTGPTATFVHLADTVTGNFNWTHYITADDGQFYFLTSRTGLGVFSAFIALQKTINNRVGDTRNVFAMASAVIVGRGSPDTATIVDTAAGCVGRNPNGSVNTLGGIQRAGQFGATTYENLQGIDALTGQYLSFPCHVASLGTQTAYRGELPDLYQIGQATVGGSIPSAAAQERVVAGGLVVPFPTVNPTM